MTNRQQAWGMWVMAALLVAAFVINVDLRDSGEPHRPLHIILCLPLAFYCAVVGVKKWLAGRHRSAGSRSRPVARRDTVQ